ncbi:hypothetical protein F4861DRAFT_42983 [Xylaria intraflava]|nr:hypothetical protein F4861DRAFT_42983 [Xylaria intraflava]
MRFWTALSFASSAGLAAASTSGGYGASSISYESYGGYGGYGQQPIGGIGAQYPGSCRQATAHPGLNSALRGVLGQCFPNNVIIDAAVNYYTTVIQETTNLIEIINQAGCDKPNPGPGPKPNPGPGPKPDDSPKPADDKWWNCDGRSPCKWLDLQPAETALAASTDQAALPHPNTVYKLMPDYKYPFDTWVTASSGALQIFVDGQKVKEQGDGNFLIPAGTAASAVKYKSPSGASIQFAGACSKDTPCLGRQLQDWAAGYTYSTQPDAEVNIGGYDYDVILTLADTSKTTEQYHVLIDGKEIDKTHGPLTLGDAKYDPANIPPNFWAWEGKIGALESITHGGFWGSFRIPAGTEKVTVHLGHFEPGFPNYIFAYRLDKLCQC